MACFRITNPDNADPDEFHARIAHCVQARGRAYLATIAVRGRTVLRACLCNYRTATDDLDLLSQEVLHAADADEPPRPR
ncbi:hypothetical protein [Streptomyces sp. NPDC059063]|uniref:hypothetical protein n=1 Tax=unclassified Streptomyces TaxID=2593676 RepID=UPI0036AD3FCC